MKIKQKITIGFVLTLAGFFIVTGFIIPKEKTNVPSPIKDGTTYYVYGKSWGNGNLAGGLDENGTDGVTYITNIASMTGSSDYEGYNLVKSSALIQFHDEAESRYSKDIYQTYFVGGTDVVIVWDTYELAENQRKKAIANAKSEGAIVRYMNDFELDND